MNDRYFLNSTGINFLNYEKTELIEKIDIFLTEASKLLYNFYLDNKTSTSWMKNGSLYVGSTGVINCLMRLARMGYTMNKDLVNEIPSHKKFQYNRIGFDADDLSWELLACLLNGSPFDIDQASYSFPEIPDELLYGRSGLALMINYYVKKGMKLKNIRLIENIVDSINLKNFPWSWNDKVSTNLFFSSFFFKYFYSFSSYS